MCTWSEWVTCGLRVFWTRRACYRHTQLYGPHIELTFTLGEMVLVMDDISLEMMVQPSFRCTTFLATSFLYTTFTLQFVHGIAGRVSYETCFLYDIVLNSLVPDDCRANWWFNHRSRYTEWPRKNGTVDTVDVQDFALINSYFGHFVG